MPFASRRAPLVVSLLSAASALALTGCGASPTDDVAAGGDFGTSEAALTLPGLDLGHARLRPELLRHAERLGGSGSTGSPAPAPRVSVSVENRVCPEGDSGERFCSIPVRLSAAADHDVRVFVEVEEATSSATAGVDYRVSSFGITIAAGQRDGEIPLAILGDTDPEADEVIAFRLARAEGAEVGTARGSVLVLNDDAARVPPPVDPAPAAGSIGATRGFHTATALPDGRVVVIGGFADGAPSASIVVIGTDGRVQTAPFALHAPRYRHTATLLADGRILVVGGVGTGSPAALASTEIVDVARGLVTEGAALADGRLNHNAVALADGSVLVAGGVEGAAGGRCFASAERFVPGRLGAPDRVIPAENALPAGSDAMAAARVADGSVLFLGGACADPLKVVRYVPGVGFRREPSNLLAPRVGATATALPDGRVLLAGGMDTMTGVVGTATEFVNASTAAVSAGPSLAEGRFGHRAEALDDGRVILSGGSFLGPNLRPRASVEVFEPATGAFRTAFTLASARNEHATARVGLRVFHIGGMQTAEGGYGPLATYEVTELR
jgi:hypothetical protein